MIRRSVDGRDEIFICGRHHLLMVIPESFPDRAPHLIWLSSIFHPNLMADEPVWPPRFSWKEFPSLVLLMGALVDTLVGLRVRTKGILDFATRSPLNRQASSWFRKRRRDIVRFGRNAGYPLGLRPDGLPLVSSHISWRLDGTLTGGRPMIFLSRLFREGVSQFADHGPGWLLGQQGSWESSRWYYVDRIVPLFKGSICPDSAIGVFHHAGREWKPSWKGADRPLLSEARNGRPIFKTDPSLTEIDGYFITEGGLRSSEGSPQPAPEATRPPIKVGPPQSASDRVQGPETVNSELASGPDELGGESPERRLETPLCVYCGIICAPDHGWSLCVHCNTAAHKACLEESGGCLYTGCLASPLYES